MASGELSMAINLSASAPIAFSISDACRCFSKALVVCTESGGKADRPELERSLTFCELTGSTILVASLDRLSRDVMFLEQIKRRCEAGGFEFKCCDMPEANSFLLGVMAQLAQYERQRISERTSAALQAAKRRGVQLGNPMGVAAFHGRQAIGAKGLALT